MDKISGGSPQRASGQLHTTHEDGVDKRDIVIKPTPRRVRGNFANATAFANGDAKERKSESNRKGSGEISWRRRRPGRPRGSKNKPKPPIIVTRDITPNTLTSHVVEVRDGCDIMESLSEFARSRLRGVCVLSGNGCVSDVTVRQLGVLPDAASDPISSLQGRFGILSLSGTFLPPPFLPPTFNLTLYLARGDGLVMGGCVVGPLRASGTVVIMVASFGSAMYESLPQPGRGGGAAEQSGGGGGGGGGGSSSGSMESSPQSMRDVEGQAQVQQEQHNGAVAAASDDLLDGLPWNIVSSSHEEAYWTGAGVASPLAF